MAQSSDPEMLLLIHAKLTEALRLVDGADLTMCGIHLQNALDQLAVDLDGDVSFDN